MHYCTCRLKRVISKSFLPTHPDKAISKVEKQKSLKYSYNVFWNGIHQPCFRLKSICNTHEIIYNHMLGWADLLTKQASPTKPLFTWSFFFSSSTCRSCSEVSTISIRCMSLISKRWDSRNWSLAFCHVCFNWLCCCRSCSKRWQTV